MAWLLFALGLEFSFKDLKASRSIGEVGIRKKTGASVVGVLRGDSLSANPDAEFRFQANDLVAIMGTDEARRAFQALAAPPLEPSSSETHG